MTQPAANIFCEPSNSIRVQISDVHFRGIFATTNIKKDSIIEQCPLVPLSNRSRYHNDPTLVNYLYANKNCDCSECKNHGYMYYMVLGYGMLYNHSETPNAKWDFDYKNFIANLVSTTDIKESEEIFVSYGSQHIVNHLGSDNAKNNQ